MLLQRKGAEEPDLNHHNSYQAPMLKRTSRHMYSCSLSEMCVSQRVSLVVGTSCRLSTGHLMRAKRCNTHTGQNKKGLSCTEARHCMCVCRHASKTREPRKDRLPVSKGVSAIVHAHTHTHTSNKASDIRSIHVPTQPVE